MNGLKLILALALLSSTACAGTSAQQASAPARAVSKKPNVLFIAVDDLRPELGCYGAEHIQSPRIDQLAGEGLLFERAYSQMAVCMPSRASLMSGYYPTHNNMFQRKAMFDHVPDVVSLNQHFMNNGYETVNIGKIYHHASDDSTGWTRDFRHIDGPWDEKGYREKKTPGRYGLPYEHAEVDDSGYETAALADQAIEQFRTAGDKPLFVALGFRKPHLPFNAPQKYWDLYDPEEITKSRFPQPPQNAAKEGYADWAELRNYLGIPKEGPVTDEEMILNLIHGYRACVSYVDAQIGRVLDEIDRLGLRENTIVILWADHGWKLGDYNMWCKHSNYEIDTRVPMLVRTPGMAAVGERSFAPVGLIDMYPTLCDLAGLEKPPHLQGQSFAPLLDAPDMPWNEAAFTIWVRKPNAVSLSGAIGYSMRSGNYRYTEWRDLNTDELVARELYDHSQGSSLVSANEADYPENEALLARLSAMLEEWRRQYGAHRIQTEDRKER